MKMYDILFWFFYLECIVSIGEMLCKSLDCLYNLIYFRVFICIFGFGNVISEGWKVCVRFNVIVLK